MPAAWESAPLVEAESGAKPAWESAPLVEETQATQEAPELSYGEKVIGGMGLLAGGLAQPGGPADVNVSMLRQLVAYPLSGFAGIAGTVLPGPEGQGAEWVKKTQEILGGQPMTLGGRAAAAGLSSTMQPAVEAARAPGSYLAEKGVPALGIPPSQTTRVAGAVLSGVPEAALQGMALLKPSGKVPTGKFTPATESVVNAYRAFEQKTARPSAPVSFGEGTPTPRGQINPEMTPEARASRLSMGAAETPKESMGAALTSTPTEIAAAIANASPELKQIVSNIPINEISKPTLMAHLEADSLPKPVRLMGPQASQDPVALSDLYNQRGVPGSRVPELMQQQNRDLIENTDLIRDTVAPDVYSTRKIEASENIIDAYRTLDEGNRQEIRSAYKALEDANGGQFPVDGASIAQNSFAALAKKLKTDYLSGPIRKQLDAFLRGEPMSFEMFEAMRTNLADEIRTAERAGNGNAAMAASIVRSEMEKLPMTPGTGEQLKGLADTARGLAKARFDMIKKDPAYKAIVKAEDATINEKLPADNFYDKFVLNGAQRNLQTMIETFGENSPVHQEIRAGTMFHLKERAGIDSENRGNFTQAGYNKALEKLDRSNKMGTIFDAEGQRLTRALGNTAFRIQFQPKGSFVSNPNTVVGLIREASAGALEKAFNMTGIPAGTLARQALEAASQRKAAEPYLAPLAGVRIQRVKGQPKAPTLKELEEKTSPGMTPKGRGQRGAITLGGVPKTERTGTAPTLSQLPENQKLGQTLVGKKQRGSVEVVEKGSEMIYHGTTAKAAAAIERDGFDLSLSADGTVWFTSNPKIGEVAASGKGGVVARSVSDLKLGGWKEADLYSTNELIAKGYDGLKLVDGDEITYQIFFPEKLKIPGQSGKRKGKP